MVKLGRTKQDAIPVIPAQAVHLLFLCACDCGTEWIDSCETDQNGIIGDITQEYRCPHCGLMGYIEQGVSMRYVRGTVLNGPPIAESGDTMAVQDSP